MAYVNIVTSDTGWILERLAKEIEQRLPYVKYSQDIDPAAAIHYYVTYSRRRQRVSPIEVAYFAHLEQNKKTAEQFFAVAKDVDYCVCHADLYADIIRNEGIDTVTTISPGVDLDFFVPRVKIGVVGRTYHTGRKGEHLIAKVMDIPGIDWHFTGEGWPGPALKIAPERLADFYRELDYVLVPALYEGGPMCVVEALACGTPVIAPPIGWVGEFPHIEYKTGDADDLRRVLLEVVAEKTRLRESVLDRTWDAWADGHDRLFVKLMRDKKLKPGAKAGDAAAPRARSVQLMLHGSEGSSLGGPTVRVPRTAQEMREQGLAAQMVRFPDPSIGSTDVMHGFNVWSPMTSLAMARKARTLGKPFVFSPIYLDLSQRPFWDEELQAIFEANNDPVQIDTLLAESQQRRALEANLRDAPQEPLLGYHSIVRELVDSADHVVLLSDHEKWLLAQIGAIPKESSIVRNPVDGMAFAAADPELFSATTGIRDYVLCVARVEPRKNQLMLVHALRDTGLPVVLVGHVSSRKYADLIRKIAGPTVHFIDRLDPGSPMLLSAFSGARVLVLPSWAEGAPLVALEGAAAGACMVLSDRSGEREYFGEMARYCDPGSAKSIRSAVLEAYNAPWGKIERNRLKAHVNKEFSWDKYTRGTREAYDKAVAQFNPRSHAGLLRNPGLPPATGNTVNIVMDVTTSANHRGRWTGISRVEMALGHALAACPNVRVHFVAWADSARRFVLIPIDAFYPEYVGQYVAHVSQRRDAELSVPAGASFIVAGSGWMQNPRYAEAVTLFAGERQLGLTPIFHDLIPVSHPFWFNDGYAPVFEKNLSILLSASSRILAISENTKRDVESFASARNLSISAVQVFREGDSIEIPGGSPTASESGKISEIEGLLAGSPFVLSVGAIHTRKNHKLLYDLWVRLAAALGNKCPRLVLVGGVAWNGADLARTIRADARVKKLIHIVEDVDDRVLQWLYAGCMFTVYPSLYEGWGLPVGESLRFGKICIASNTSSVPEIAPQLTDLIDPFDFSMWYARVLFYVGSETARAEREAQIKIGYRPLEWGECAQSVVEMLRNPSDLGFAPNLYAPGTLVRLGELDTAVLYRTLSWHFTESWGAWSSGPKAGLRLALTGPCVGPYSLVVRARALVAPGAAFYCTVAVNGHTLSRLRFTNGTPKTFCLFVPAKFVGKDRIANIVFENERIQRIGDLTNAKTDERRVGVGVEFVGLMDLGYKIDIPSYLDAKERVFTRKVTGQFISLLSAEQRGTILEGDWGRSAWGQIAISPDARLSLPLHEDLEADAVIDFKLRAVATEASPQAVLVMANGTPVARWLFKDDAYTSCKVEIPREIRFRQQPMTLEFVARNDRSPASLGLGTEARSFAVAFSEIRYGTEHTIEQRGAVNNDGVALYKLGRSIAFKAAGHGALDIPLSACASSGWFPPEKDGAWTQGSIGSLGVRLTEAPRSSLLMDVSVRGMGTKRLGPSEIKFLVNNTHAFSISLTSDAWYQTTGVVPLGILQGATDARIDIVADRSRSPFSLGGKDDRILGVQVGSISLRSVARCELGEPLDMSDTAAALAVAGNNWYPAERAGLWSRGATGTLYLEPDSVLGGKLRLLAIVRVVQASPDNPVTIRLLINGKICGVIDVNTPQYYLFDAPIAAEILEISPVLKIDFEQPSAVSPKSLGIGHDERVLGVLVRSLTVVSAESADWAVSRLPGFEEAKRISSAVSGKKKSAAFTPLLPEVLASAEATSVPSPETHWDEADNVSVFGAPIEGLASHPDIPAGQMAPVIELDEVVQLGGASPIQPLLRGAWHNAEPDGIWSGETAASLLLQLPERAADGVRLKVLARVYGTMHSGAATVYVSVNGESNTAWYFEQDGLQDNEIVIPAAVLESTRMLDIQFERPNASSPAENGASADSRRLGIKICEFVVLLAEQNSVFEVAQKQADASYEKIYGNSEDKEFLPEDGAAITKAPELTPSLTEEIDRPGGQESVFENIETAFMSADSGVFPEADRAANVIEDGDSVTLNQSAESPVFSDGFEVLDSDRTTPKIEESPEIVNPVRPMNSVEASIAAAIPAPGAEQKKNVGGRSGGGRNTKKQKRPK